MVRVSADWMRRKCRMITRLDMPLSLGKLITTMRGRVGTVLSMDVANNSVTVCWDGLITDTWSEQYLTVVK